MTLVSKSKPRNRLERFHLNYQQLLKLNGPFNLGAVTQRFVQQHPGNGSHDVKIKCGGDWHSCEGNEQGWTTSDLWVTLKNRLLETKLACSSGICFRQIKKGNTSVTVCQSVYLAALMARVG